MTINVAINGFGRIGRNILRAKYENEEYSDIKIVAINDLGNSETNAHLLQYDTAHGKFKLDVKSEKNKIIVDNSDEISVYSERDPSNLPWKKLSVDIVLECTGFFASKSLSSAHISAGAKKVIISAPAKEVDATIVYGVNHDILNESHTVISNASCTTNCLAPVAKVLADTVGIEAGYMTTIHAYTGDQPTLDSSHKDMRRARAAAMSMIPTSTGATSAVGEVLPELVGKMNGSAIRVPTANVSVVDLVVTTSRDTSLEDINQAFRDAANGALKGVLGLNERPLVSIDFNHDPHSSVVDLTQTNVANKRFVRVLSWYDNEWGFSCRMLDTAAAMRNYL